jgi:hypothetical protein
MHSSKYQRIQWMLIPVFLFSSFMSLKVLHSQEDKMPFYPGGAYLKEIPTPEDVIGFSLGEKPVRHGHVLQYFKALAEKSQRVRLKEIGKTYFGRAPD